MSFFVLLIGFVEGQDDPPCDPRAGVRGHAVRACGLPRWRTLMWRLIARRADPAQDLQVAAVLPQGFADLVEEIGIDGRTPLDILGGAGDVDRRGQQFL